MTPGPLSLTESCRDFTDDRCGYGRVFAETDLGTKSNPPRDILGVAFAMGTPSFFPTNAPQAPRRPAGKPPSVFQYGPVTAKLCVLATRQRALIGSRALSAIYRTLCGQSGPRTRASRLPKQPIDTWSAAGKAFLDTLCVFAEFETNLRKERQLEGIAAAKVKGVYKGSATPNKLRPDEIKLALLSRRDNHQICRDRQNAFVIVVAFSSRLSRYTANC